MHVFENGREEGIEHLVGLVILVIEDVNKSLNEKTLTPPSLRHVTHDESAVDTALF